MKTDVPRRKLAGIPFVISTMDEAVEAICGLAHSATCGADIHLLNAYSISLAETNADFASCLSRASYNYPDGKPLSLLTKWSNRPLHQVRGPSLFELTMDRGRKHGIKHFLLGSTPETLTALKSNLESRYSGLDIVGTISPPFRAMSDAEVKAQDDLIRQAGANIVWVGLGTPKQDFEAQRLADNGFISIAVGAAFDFSAGTKNEAPLWMTKYGLEWVYRLSSEPRRLWKRYLVGNCIFLWAIARRGRNQ